MNAAEFRKLVAEHFSPKIRELGWKGSGFHFRKKPENHIGNLFGIQGSWYGGSVCCETAIYFDFIPDLAGLNFEKSTYASSLIRKRLSPKGDGDYHWNFSNDLEKNIESVKSIWNAFEEHGIKFYNDFGDFPHPFDKINPNDLRKSDNYFILGKYNIGNNVEVANLLKEVNTIIGRREIAQEFSEIGIERVNILAERLLVGRKTKTYRKNERFIEMQIEKLRVK
ncbi:DUF4304 domain-containing protein [Flavobacteriaceae bacterium S0825]|uniref:DUF4304 domain-containing protein n=1 Tax=Gaetbulibacter sp. S0825 TaxID=2720084 RepID=UPI0014322BAF|nr:DUF4304 domain-containing protein [Gaetbulibacter sp. S0825]MCK0108009.1 DUF4304 domain-containing protein [Flavobacteriaceae bacterium S0825]NIX63645.1 DUF4304 domain-containing protein [Gaetbulibacter sp. S0825]